MLLIRNMALTVGTTSPLAANFPTNPTPMGGSSLLIAFVNIGGVAATGIGATGWTSAGAAITNGTTVQQAFFKNAASDTGTVTFSWTGASTYAEVFIVEVYSTQGSVPTLGTYATGSGTGTTATFPSPTLTQASELLLGCILLAANTNILYPNGPSFASGFGGGALTLYDNLNQTTRSCVAFFGCRGTTLPTMPATSWSGSQAWIMTALPILEAAAGDPVITGVGLIDNTAFASAPANNQTTPVIPATAQVGDILVACIGQGKGGGANATGQAIAPHDLKLITTDEALPSSSFTIPASIQVGDLMIATFSTFDSTSAYAISPPAGWTAIQNVNAVAGSHVAAGAWYRVATAGDTGGATTYTWSVSPAVNLVKFVAYFRSVTGGALSVDVSTNALVGGAASGNFPSVSPGTINEWVVCYIAQTTNVPTMDSKLTILTTVSGAGTQAGYAPQAATGAMATETWGNGHADGVLLTFSIKSSAPASFTRIRGDNEPNSTYSQDLFWRKMIAGDSSFPFATAQALNYLQGQIVSIGNVDGVNPIDDNQGVANPGQGAGFGAPPCLNVSSNSGFALWFWGLNQTFRDGSNRTAPNANFNQANTVTNNVAGAGPITPIYDTYSDAGQGSTPRRMFTIGYGSPDMLDRPQYCSASQSVKAWVGQSLALKATTSPVRSSTQLQLNLASLVVIGTSAVSSAQYYRPRHKLPVVKPVPLYNPPRRSLRKLLDKISPSLAPNPIRPRDLKRRKKVAPLLQLRPLLNPNWKRHLHLFGEIILSRHAGMSLTLSMKADIQAPRHATMALSSLTHVAHITVRSGALTVPRHATMAVTLLMADFVNGMPILPAIPGLGWDVSKTLEMDDMNYRTAKGRLYRATQQTYPVWHFGLKWNYLKAGGYTTPLGYETLLGFFGESLGQANQFLYDDPSDDLVPTSNPASLGVGDGTNKNFQLVRNLYTSSGTVIYTEPIFAVKPGTTTVYLNGVAQSSSTYAINNGLLTFNSAPANGAAVSWAGGFYFVCRFSEDEGNFESIFYKFKEYRELRFQTVKQP